MKQHSDGTAERKQTMNKVILIGHIGKDPDLRYTASGTAVAKFSMATAEKIGKGENRKQQTDWHKIVTWGKQAEFVGEYVKKGNQLAITGKIQTRDWEDRDGIKRYTTEIIAHHLEFGGGKKDNNSQQRPATTEHYPDDEPMDEVPF
jgi:single-strand DNA-binding protein